MNDDISLADFAAMEMKRQELDEDVKIARGRMTVETRLYFDVMQAYAEQRVSNSRALLLSFWSQLCERTPDLGTIRKTLKISHRRVKIATFWANRLTR